MSDSQSSAEIKKMPPRKGDKVEVVRILILAVVSFVLGFGLVIFFLGPQDSKSQNDLQSPAEQTAAETTAGPVENNAIAQPEVAVNGQSPPSEGYGPGALSENPLLPAQAQGGGQGGTQATAVQPSAPSEPAPVIEPAEAQSAATAGAAPETGAPQEAEETATVNEANAPPEVPPGKTPDNVALDGGAFYLKCWDKSGTAIPGASCDKLSVLEKRVATRVYVVDRCKKKHAGDKAQGKLSLGVEVDFDKASVNYWNGPSSTLENAAKVATCLRTELNGLPIRGAAHKYSKYRMFFTVLFGDAKAIAKEKAAADKAALSTKDEKNDAPKNATKGKPVKVLKDNVRVRKTPNDGEVIGKIGKDNEVRLLEKKGEWCKVLTPNNNEGWMICEALSK
jgi:hypothetical protein